MTARLCIYSRDKGAWAGSAPQAAWYQFALTAPHTQGISFSSLIDKKEGP